MTKVFYASRMMKASEVKRACQEFREQHEKAAATTNSKTA